VLFKDSENTSLGNICFSCDLWQFHLRLKYILTKKNAKMGSINKPTKSTLQKPLRIWPGVVIVILQWLIRFIIPNFAQEDIVTQIGVFGGLLGGFAIIIWWAFFSRATRFERWVAIVLMIVSLALTSQFLDKSIETAMMGMMFMIYSIPVLSLAFVVWAVASRNLSAGLRRVTMLATILLSTGFWVFLRTDGMDADANHDFAWRWAKTAEEKLMTQANDMIHTMPADSAKLGSEAEWPGFRGLNRDGIIHGVRIISDWKESPPVEMWRRPIGPGCSSFAVHGNLLFTQEQRGENEMVTCYKLDTGEPVWVHSDSARFWDSHAGAGPRSTPTLLGGHIYTLGATGILNVLNAGDGSVVWSRNAASDAKIKVLPWGFTSSPLVIDSMVVVALSGKLAAYDIVNGKPLWFGPDGGNSYSSPHLLTIDGVQQVILMSNSGALSVEPGSGKQLWKYDWPIEDRILQPAVIAEGELLLTGEYNSIKRINVSSTEGNWSVKELWKSTEMILNFNDIVIHKGYAYGFDGPKIACTDIKDGRCLWRGKPYRGWLLLLADQDLLLLLTEKGELALVEANPSAFKELAWFPAIKGKTWNHPVLVGDILLVRNSLEMAAFRLLLAGC
jgi:outer membrane protein assembly factor BamB